MSVVQRFFGNAWARVRGLPWTPGRIAVAATALVVLLGAGAVATVRLAANRVDASIPQTDLFGEPTPSSTGTPTAGTPSAGPVTPPATTPTPSPMPGAGITGPLNILIVGVDTRYQIPTWQPHADAVMILHVAKDLRRASLVSLPRDLVVQVPAFRKAGYGGGRTKLTHAMSYGSRVPGTNIPNTAQGFQLVAATVSNYTGIKRFDAGAVLDFIAFERVIDQLGGIDIYVDQQVKSIHLQPNGKYRRPDPGSSSGYGGPQSTYHVGMRHLNGWQALDYSRQRYNLPKGDYDRSRHHRQLIKAMVARGAKIDVLSDPLKVDRIVQALGKGLTFDGRGKRFVDYAYALRNVRAETLTLVDLPGDSVFSGGTYLGEGLAGVQSQYFAAVRGDRVEAFLRANPRLVNTR